jgi:hypothetical protein
LSPAQWLPPGQAGSLEFRDVSVAPTLRPAGTYTIDALYGNDGDPFATANKVSTASEVIYNGSRSTVSNGFPAGDDLGCTNGYFGPNFQFTTPSTKVNGVPDSGGAFVMMVASVADLLGLHQLLQRRKAELA